MTDNTNRNSSTKLWDVRRVAEEFDCNVSTVWRWTKAGQIPAPIKIGGTVRWRCEDIERFIAEQTAA